MTVDASTITFTPPDAGTVPGTAAGAVKRTGCQLSIKNPVVGATAGSGGTITFVVSFPLPASGAPDLCLPQACINGISIGSNRYFKCALFMNCNLKGEIKGRGVPCNWKHPALLRFITQLFDFYDPEIVECSVVDVHRVLLGNKPVTEYHRVFLQDICEHLRRRAGTFNAIRCLAEL